MVREPGQGDSQFDRCTCFERVELYRRYSLTEMQGLVGGLVGKPLNPVFGQAYNEQQLCKPRRLLDVNNPDPRISSFPRDCIGGAHEQTAVGFTYCSAIIADQLETGAIERRSW